jgi:hypothetical protein
MTEEVIAKLGLTESELAALTRHGIIFGDKAPYEVPELFRSAKADLGRRQSQTVLVFWRWLQVPYLEVSQYPLLALNGYGALTRRTPNPIPYETRRMPRLKATVVLPTPGDCHCRHPALG